MKCPICKRRWAPLEWQRTALFESNEIQFCRDPDCNPEGEEIKKKLAEKISVLKVERGKLMDELLTMNSTLNDVENKVIDLKNEWNELQEKLEKNKNKLEEAGKEIEVGNQSEKILGKFPELRDALNMFLVYVERDGLIWMHHLADVKSEFHQHMSKMHEDEVKSLAATINASEIFAKLKNPPLTRSGNRSWAKEQRIKYGFIDENGAQIL